MIMVMMLLGQSSMSFDVCSISFCIALCLSFFFLGIILILFLPGSLCSFGLGFLSFRWHFLAAPELNISMKRDSLTWFLSFSCFSNNRMSVVSPVGSGWLASCLDVEPGFPCSLAFGYFSPSLVLVQVRFMSIPWNASLEAVLLENPKTCALQRDEE